MKFDRYIFHDFFYGRCIFKSKVDGYVVFKRSRPPLTFFKCILKLAEEVLKYTIVKIEPSLAIVNNVWQNTRCILFRSLYKVLIYRSVQVLETLIYSPRFAINLNNIVRSYCEQLYQQNQFPSIAI